MEIRIILVVIFLLPLIFVVVTYNTMVRLGQMITESWSFIVVTVNCSVANAARAKSTK